MTLGRRKLIVVAVIAEVFLLANAFALLRWLAAIGLIDLAHRVRSEYLTGTAITIIVVLLFLVGSPVYEWQTRRCRVCDHALPRQGKYCPVCGSRL